MLPVDSTPPGAYKVLGVVYLMMGVVCLAGGAFLFLNPAYLAAFSETIRYVFCGVVLLYGAWRAYTGLMLLIGKKNKRMTQPSSLTREGR
jgi:hypothetical protein